MMQLDYTWERREELIRAEEYEEGIEKGREEGIEKGIEKGIKRGREEGIDLFYDTIQKLKQGILPEKTTCLT